MPFNELLISLNAWDNKREREVLDTQFIAYHAMIGSHLDPKKIPSFKKFTNIEEPIKIASEKSRQAVLKEYQEYKRIKEGKG